MPEWPAVTKDWYFSCITYFLNKFLAIVSDLLLKLFKKSSILGWVVSLIFRFKFLWCAQTRLWNPTLQRGSRWTFGKSKNCAEINTGWVRLPPRYLPRDSQMTWKKSRFYCRRFSFRNWNISFYNIEVFFEIEVELLWTRTFSERQLLYINQKPLKPVWEWKPFLLI